MKRLCILTLILMVGVDVCAQKIVSVHGKYSLEISESENITISEAKIECIKNARCEAIKNSFGEIITSNTNLVDQDVNGKTISRFVEETAIMSKAEWIEDTRNPEVSFSSENGKYVFTAEVWGKAREITLAQIDFSWKVLCGGTSDKNESDIFNNKERIYITFKTPVTGYVAVYLLDSTNKEASCLLPYKNNNKGRHKVVPNKRHVFFDKNSDPQAIGYSMTTKAPLELDQIVLIFSPNPFTKCNEITGDRRHPNTLSIDDFEKWLSKMRKADNDMVVDRSKWIKIINSDI